VVIGAQKGPTSASKRDPPGFRGPPGRASLSGPAPGRCSCSSPACSVPSRRRVKRSRALRGRNPTRD